MTSRSYILTTCAVTAFLLCGHFGINSYFKARQFKAQAETIAVRTNLIKHQIGEMEQKTRVLQQVEHFITYAKDLRMDRQDWSAYDVNIQDALSFQKLSRIVEQCVHNKDIYFKPIAFHVAVNHGDSADPADASAIEPVPLDAGASQDETSDVFLALQGTFMVRH